MKNVLKLVTSMAIFGSIGIVVTYVPLPSATLAGLRALLGALFMAVCMVMRKAPVNKAGVKNNLVWLIVSGIALALNWLLLFEAYRYTSVAVATLCYYMAPVFVTILSPFVLGEKLTTTKLFCTLIAVAGAVLISGASLGDRAQFQGILYALGAAALYCTVILLNKKINRLPAQETTFYQLLVAAVVVLPYALVTQSGQITLSGTALCWLLVIGIVHTCLAYLLFFGAAAKLPAQSTAILSYIDPVTAIILSVVVLHQSVTTFQIIGAVMILGSTFISECFNVSRRRR